MEKEATSARAEVESARSQQGAPPNPPPCMALWYSPQQTTLWARVLQGEGVWGSGGAREAGGGAEGATTEE